MLASPLSCVGLSSVLAVLATLTTGLLGPVAALSVTALGAQNRAGASNPATHIHTRGQSVRNPCSRRDPVSVQLVGSAEQWRGVAAGVGGERVGEVDEEGASL